jgi:hypothetical protein
MKHAFLIGAYKDPESLCNLVEQLDGDDSCFYISVSTKSNLLAAPIIQKLRLKPNVFLFRRFGGNWGGFTHFKAHLFLLKLALSNSTIEYFHSLSGQCFPIKSRNYITEFFAQNRGKAYFNFIDIPAPVWASERGGLDRLELYHINDLVDRRSGWGLKFTLKFQEYQKKLRIKRGFPKDFPKLYAGSSWTSYHRDFVEYIFNFIKNNPPFCRRFRYTHAPEEFFFATILCNSPLKKRSINNNLRYYDWRARNGSSPAILDASDYEVLISSDRLFARKFEHPISAGLVQRLKDNFSNDSRY